MYYPVQCETHVSDSKTIRKSEANSSQALRIGDAFSMQPLDTCDFWDQLTSNYSLEQKITIIAWDGKMSQWWDRRCHCHQVLIQHIQRWKTETFQITKTFPTFSGASRAFLTAFKTSRPSRWTSTWNTSGIAPRPWSDAIRWTKKDGPPGRITEKDQVYQTWTLIWPGKKTRTIVGEVHYCRVGNWRNL